MQVIVAASSDTEAETQLGELKIYILFWRIFAIALNWMSLCTVRQILSPFILIQNTIMGISHLDILQHYVPPILQDEGLVEVMFQQDGTLPTSHEVDESVLEYCVSTEMEWYWEIKTLATKFTCHATILFSLGMYKVVQI